MKLTAADLGMRLETEALGARTTTSPGGHLNAQLAFGAASYRIFYVPKRVDERAS